MTHGYLTAADAEMLKERLATLTTRSFSRDFCPEIDPKSIYCGMSGSTPCGYATRYQFYAVEASGNILKFSVDSQHPVLSGARSKTEWESHPARVQEEIASLTAEQERIAQRLQALRDMLT